MKKRCSVAFLCGLCLVMTGCSFGRPAKSTVPSVGTATLPKDATHQAAQDLFDENDEVINETDTGSGDSVESDVGHNAADIAAVAERTEATIGDPGGEETEPLLPQATDPTISFDSLQKQLFAQLAQQPQNVSFFSTEDSAYQSEASYKASSSMDEGSFTALITSSTYTHGGRSEGELMLAMDIDNSLKRSLNTTFSAKLRYTLLEEAIYVLMEDIVTKSEQVDGADEQLEMIKNMFGGSRIEIPLQMGSGTDGLGLPQIQKLSQLELNSLHTASGRVRSDLEKLLPNYSLLKERMSKENVYLVEIDLDQVAFLRDALVEKNEYIAFLNNRLSISSGEPFDSPSLTLSDWLGKVKDNYSVQAELKQHASEKVTLKTTLITNRTDDTELPAEFTLSDGSLSGYIHLSDEVEMMIRSVRLDGGKRSMQLSLEQPEKDQSVTFVGIFEQTVADELMTYGGKGIVHFKSPKVKKQLGEFERFEMNFEYNANVKKVFPRSVEKPQNTTSVEELLGGIIGSLMPPSGGAEGFVMEQDLQYDDEFGGMEYVFDKPGSDRDVPSDLEWPDEGNTWSGWQQFDEMP